MGLYVQNAGSNIDTNHADNIRRRSSFDLLGVDEYAKDKDSKIDLGRDSVIDPADIAAIFSKKQKENSTTYRYVCIMLLYYGYVTQDLLPVLEEITSRILDTICEKFNVCVELLLEVMESLYIFCNINITYRLYCLVVLSRTHTKCEVEGLNIVRGYF